MKCLFPRRIKNPNYDSLAVLDRHRERYLTVPCGRCYACRNRKRSEWILRLKHHLQFYPRAYMITLTYNDEHLPMKDGQPCFRYRDVQLFMKRLRKRFTGQKLSYFVVGEFGDKFGRPHYHLLLFNLPKIKNHVKVQHFLSDIWQNGFVHCGILTPRGITYTVKYCFKSYVENACRCNTRTVDVLNNIMYGIPLPDFPKEFKEFHRCSTKPFIGYDYVEKYKESYRREPETGVIYDINGYCFTIPRIYVDRIYKQDESLYEQYLEFKIQLAKSESKKALFEHISILRECDLLLQDGCISLDDYYYRTKNPLYLEKELTEYEIRKRKLKSKL